MNLHPRYRRLGWLLLGLCWASLLGAVDAAAQQEKSATPPGACSASPAEAAAIRHVQTFSKASDLGWKRSFWRRLKDWMKSEEDGSVLLRPFAVATDSRGRILVADSGARDVKIFDPRAKSVKIVTGYAGRYFAAPVGIAVDDRDAFYVADAGTGHAVKFTGSGKFAGFLGNPEGDFQRPVSIAFNTANRLVYVLDAFRSQVFAYRPDGSQVYRFGGKGRGPGEFNLPSALAIDAAGRLYVADTLNFRVQVLAADGSWISQFGGPDARLALPRARGLAVDAQGRVFIADGLRSIIYVLDKDGQFLGQFGGEGACNGEFYIPAGMAVDRSGKLFVTDPFQRRVQVFDSTRVSLAARNGGRP